jgi:hypothetical protein
MGKRKSNPSTDADQHQDELDLEPSRDQNGTLDAPGDAPSGGSVARIEASGAPGAAHGEAIGGGKDAEVGPIINLPAFAMDGLWQGWGMAAVGATPMRAFRFKRLAALGATVALAAALGALAGSLATGGLGATANRESAGEATLKLALERMEQEFTALRTSVETSAQDMHTRTTRIAERLDRSERAQAEPAQKLAKITEALERLERRGAQVAQAGAATAPEVTGAIGEPRAAAAEAKKTSIVNGWVLYQVRDGAALIEGRDGLIEVEPGDMLPGLGRVETMRKQDGRWVVVTSRGLIVER